MRCFARHDAAAAILTATCIVCLWTEACKDGVQIAFQQIVAESYPLKKLHDTSTITQLFNSEVENYLPGTNEDNVILQSDTAKNMRFLQELNSSSKVFSVSISFLDIYKTILFITVAWLFGYLSQRIGMPSLVGEIVAGFILGPPLSDFVPFPEAMVLIGHIGLIGLILESGIDIDVAQLRESGTRAVLMAFTGTTLPLLAGMGLAKLANQEWKSAIAVGACFAPSAFSVAGNALSSGELLNTPMAQMVVAASVVDDVLGLIQLSILEVFVKQDPNVFDYILPFVSSFGYLIVLGYSAVTWMPRVIEHKIMPLVAEQHREFLAFALMFILLLLYMPLLNYSKASYLTGTFLAGLTFSQINSVHASFVNNGRQLLNWLLRIFFAATIGFQVPIRKLDNLYVLKWGAIFIVPILCKLPLGGFVPRFQREIPLDYPYNPYWRDVIITSLAMTCRGEFNFIISAFALGEGLIDSYLYSAVVFAVLLSSIVPPLLLLKLARYYNAKSKSFLEGNHTVYEDKTHSLYRPLYFGIQARTPVHWGLQESFKRALEEQGLIIIDHRSWHSLGQDSVDITELFVQDTKVKVRIQPQHDVEEAASCNVPSDCKENVSSTSNSNIDVGIQVEAVEKTESFELNKKLDSREEREIEDRRDEIRRVLVGCLLSDDPEQYHIQVSQWRPHVFDTVDSRGRDQVQYCLTAFPSQISFGEDDDGADESNFLENDGHKRHLTHGSLDFGDMWDTDVIAQQAAEQGYYMTPDSHGCHVEGGNARPRRNTLDPSLLRAPEEDQVTSDMVKEHLHGYVRD